MQPMFLMMLSVLAFSLYPLLASLGLQKNGPVVFLLMTHAGCAAASFLCASRLMRKKRVTWAKVFRLDRATRTYVILTGAAAAVNHACLMYAFLKCSKIGATMIYETWPILALWLAPLIAAKGETARRADYAFGLLAFAGIAFIIGADAREALLRLDLAALKSADAEKMFGYALAFCAAIGVSVSTTLRRRVTRSLREKYGDDLLLATTLSSGLTRLAALPVLLVILALTFQQPFALNFAPSTLPLAVLTGVFVHLGGSVFYVLSLLKNPNPSIPVPDFIAPILAVLWLYLSGVSGLTDLAVLGGLFVITANLLVTVRAEDGFAYTASILTLLLCGAYCYFTQGAKLDDFYDAISVSAVFYAILIAFAWDRVLERTKVEEGLLLDIAYGMEALKPEHRKKLLPDVKAVISTTDRALMGESYRRLAAAREKLGAAAEVTALFQRLDSLVLSRTKDIMLSEVVLLCLIGGVTFFGILGYRPPGLWPDMMACIMAGAIVFIFFAIFDQMTARGKTVLSGEDGTLTLVNPGLFRSRHEYKLVTIILIAIMLAAFYGLFVFKYAAGS